MRFVVVLPSGNDHNVGVKVSDAHLALVPELHSEYLETILISFLKSCELHFLR